MIKWGKRRKFRSVERVHVKIRKFYKTFSTPDTRVSCTTDLKTESKMELQMEKI